MLHVKSAESGALDEYAQLVLADEVLLRHIIFAADKLPHFKPITLPFLVMQPVTLDKRSICQNLAHIV